MKKLYFLFVSVSIAANVFSQDPVFLNTNQSLLYLNPSFAGSNGLIRNQFSYRNQWPNLSSNYVTYLNSFDMYLKPLKAGLALSYLHDDMAHGTFKNSLYSLVYAQHLNFLEKQLRIIPSVQFSYGQKRLDLNSLHFGDPVDPRWGFVWNSSPVIPVTYKDYLDMSGGFLADYKKTLYVGAYMFHFNQPDVGMLGASKLPYRLNLHASYNMMLTPLHYMQLLYRYQNQQKFSSHQLAVNMITCDHVITGLGWVSGDQAFVNAGYTSRFFSIVLGYDVVFSKLAGNTAGSWELHSSFNLRNKEQRKKRATFEGW